jgi:fermentation-respiration switch protein FrsA (DUF1100 family)
VAATTKPAASSSVSYRSRALDGSPVAVTGLVVRPAGPAPEGGFPVLTWGHGTTGTADTCAPSREPGLPIPELPELLAAGFVVAATDYQGLGTPGVHPYLVGESAGRSLLDAARAAGRVPGADAGTRVIAHGESQGGHAALFAGEIAPRYAPDLDVLGIVAAAPPADVPALISGAAASPLTFGYAFLVFATWSAVYPEADLAAVVTPEVAAQAGLVEQGCLDAALRAFPSRRLEELRVADPAAVQPWSDLLERNRAGTVAPAAPVLIVHGEADRLVPVRLSSELLDRLCGLGAEVALETYPGAGHGVVPAASGDITAWLEGRLSGQAAPTSC